MILGGMDKALNRKFSEVEFFVRRKFAYDESEDFFAFVDKYKFCLHHISGDSLWKYRLQYKFSEN